MPEYVQEQDLQSHINLVEWAMDTISTDDEYMAATLANQAVTGAKLDSIIRILEEDDVSGVAGRRDLDIGLVGVSLDDIDRDSQGRAIFSEDGDSFVAYVTPERTDVDENDYVLVNDEGNKVIEGPESLPGSLSNLSSGGDTKLPNLSYGVDTVSTVGTSEALNGGAPLTVPDGASLIVRPLVSNSGTVYMGSSAGSDHSPNGGDPGFPLPNEGEEFNLDDVSTLTVDAEQANDGVAWKVEVN